jgi:hypothetical protein
MLVRVKLNSITRKPALLKITSQIEWLLCGDLVSEIDSPTNFRRDLLIYCASEEHRRCEEGTSLVSKIEYPSLAAGRQEAHKMAACLFLLVASAAHLTDTYIRPHPGRGQRNCVHHRPMTCANIPKELNEF